MTRFERIKNMSIEEMAAKIIKANITDEYCKSDCDDNAERRTVWARTG